LIAFSNAEEMICGPKVNLGIDSGLSGCIKEIGSKGKWVLVLAGNAIQGLIIHTKLKATIFLFDDKNGSTMGGTSGMDKTYRKVLVDEVLEGLKFKGR
jgi:hypothetical protein